MHTNLPLSCLRRYAYAYPLTGSLTHSLTHARTISCHQCWFGFAGTSYTGPVGRGASIGDEGDVCCGGT